MDTEEPNFWATKCGHANTFEDPNEKDWDPYTILSSIDRSLQRMNTDYRDLIQLHSCDLNILQKHPVIEALNQAKDQGKVRFLGYSGDNDNAEWAVNSEQFDTLQTSFNIVDQKAITHLFPNTTKNNMGVIIKRPIGNRVSRQKLPRKVILLEEN